MIVVDASSLAKYALHEEGWEEVSRYVRERRPLYSVDLVLKEVGNAVWKHCYLRKMISPQEALRLFKGLKRLVDVSVIILENEGAYLDEALEIALRHGVTIYDSLYIAQAKRYGELLTSDERQAEVAKQLKLKVHLVL